MNSNLQQIDHVVKGRLYGEKPTISKTCWAQTCNFFTERRLRFQGKWILDTCIYLHIRSMGNPEDFLRIPEIMPMKESQPILREQDSQMLRKFQNTGFSDFLRQYSFWLITNQLHPDHWRKPSSIAKTWKQRRQTCHMFQVLAAHFGCHLSLIRRNNQNQQNMFILLYAASDYICMLFPQKLMTSKPRLLTCRGNPALVTLLSLNQPLKWITTVKCLWKMIFLCGTAMFHADFLRSPGLAMYLGNLLYVSYSYVIAILGMVPLTMTSYPLWVPDNDISTRRYCWIVLSPWYSHYIPIISHYCSNWCWLRLI